MKVFVYDPTASDKQSAVRGVGRYLQILKENFPEWNFSGNLQPTHYNLQPIFINPFFNFLQPPLLIRRIAKKQIAVIHDLIPLKYPKHFPIGLRGKINLFLNRLALKNYDLIITDSQASKKDIVDILKVNEEKVKVIYPCLTKKLTMQIKNPNTKLKIDQSTNYKLPTTNYCLYIGDATWNKNLVNLAKAIKIINVPCIFVGKVFTNPYELQPTTYLNHPWQKELKEFFKLTKDDTRFVFAGYVADDQLRELYQRARVNLLLSRDEGFGFSYLEAAQFQCPSVLADIPVLREISAGRGALFADPNNPSEMANQIGEIYFNLKLRNQLGIEGRQQLLRFGQDRFKKRFLSLI